MDKISLMLITDDTYAIKVDITSGVKLLTPKSKESRMRRDISIILPNASPMCFEWDGLKT
jgi:hypothetical protein